MTWVASVVVSVLSGVAGLLLAGLTASACVSWYHVSSREGASGYFVMFLGLGGGIAGLVVGLITARMVAASYGPGFGRELATALGVVLSIAGFSALLARFMADVPPKIDGRELNVLVEFRFPANRNCAKPPTAEGEWKFSLGSIAGDMQRTAEQGTIQTEEARWEEGRWILPARASLFTERGKRTISLGQGDKTIAGFLVPLPGRPGKKFEQWSEWLPRQNAEGQPWPAEKVSFRFRVEKVPLPPPPKSDEEWASDAAAEEEARFAAIPADAPIAQFIPFLCKDEQNDRALANILKRPTLLKELSQMSVASDPEEASAALRFIAKHLDPSPELIDLVQKAGSDIVTRLHKVNSTAVEADPSYLGAADISIRFSAWREAVYRLRSNSGELFTPELKAILELSRLRKDSYVMQSDV